ncbi:MAG: ribosome small subunit-dependent GTPase A [Gammaproteobacteria bacterium]|nr:ribosome small subunit-dependent GTPase A [Gammaproteobacteria bacterium]
MTSAPEPQPGLVIANYGQTLLVEASDGASWPCVARKSIGQAACGDRVLWQAGRGDAHGAVVAIEPRRSLLARTDARGKSKPLCANIDQLIVVTSPAASAGASGINHSLIDHYLVTADLLGLGATLVVNKMDLAGELQAIKLRDEMARYQAMGYEFRAVSAKTRDGLPELGAQLKDRTSVFVGESGVGKSSLLQALLPDHEIRVGALSEASGKGRHTTTSTLLFHLPRGGDIIDSPGVREFRLWNISAAELARGFREFRPFLDNCRFRDCVHDGEPGCAVTLACEQGKISRQRLDSYRAILHKLPVVEYD